MSLINKVLILGNLGKDPEVRQAGDNSVASFAVATSEKYKNKQGEMVENTEWHNVVVWGKMAEVCGKYLQKGSKVFLEGQLKTDKYTDKNGVDKYSTKIVANHIKFMDTKEFNKKEDKKEDPNPLDDIPF